ncbi:acyl-CoA dehydrogenase family protein [Methylobacterium bullatum]|uniref:Acyl-CoA dehydrogenase YdbM n=1 Tax=Methylobacterium bullatum TaxID=570505 RepID=A0AAV4ZCZ6_9HYPH|nr:acyl-CoA dehydrogenase family protein [Methylobacterium bullatum]MBD8902337.1 acyl-CoA dehydrogenase [Methylobacterium bullatum]GJD41410.1 Putative acyl-CoA dehydrogenase YdbM [Methylobacterium bullatum]
MILSPPLRDTAEGLARLFAERAEGHDRAGRFAHDNIADLRNAGLPGLIVPRRLGGGGAGLGAAAMVVGTLARGEPSTALVVTMHFLQHGLIHAREHWPRAIADRLGRAAVEDGALINALRVEPELGTPARGGLPETVARATVTGWRVSGRKIYSTGSPALTHGLVFVRTDEAEPRIGNILVPMASPGVRIEETWDHLGLRASGSHDVIFEDVEVPADHAVDLRPPEGWRKADADQQAWSTTMLSALYDGVARSAHAWSIAFAKDRKPGSLGQSLATLPRFQDAIGENERLLSLNARLIRSVAAEVDGGACPSISESGFLKATVTENAIQVVQRAVELAGNPGLSRANPLERHLRDVLCGRIHWPQADSVRVSAGRTALGL